MKYPRFLHFVTIAIMALATFFVSQASAQQLKIATGSTTGTYTAEANDIKKFCGNELVLNVVNTSGSVENLDLLLGNKVNAIWVQSDLLYRRSRNNDDLANVKTLLAMHPEQLHFIAKSNAIKDGGYKVGGMQLGGSEVVLQDISQLQGRKLAAWGGSVETAKQVRLDSEIQFNLIQVNNFGEAIAALDAKQVDAVLMVGGAPMDDIAGNVEKKIPGLGPEYRLLSVPPQVVAKLKDSYPRQDRLSYSKMGAQAIPTVSVEALFVTREYKTAKMQESLAALRNCVITKIDEIKESDGTHPAWQKVFANNKGAWPYYNLPGTASAAAPSTMTPAAVPAKKK